jgi:hypothetical protein
MLAAACSPAGVDLDGRSCPCVSGYFCEPATKLCVRDVPDAAGAGDAGACAGTPTTTRLAPAADTFINLNADVNGADPHLLTYTWPDYQLANAILIQFDLSTLPAGTVSSASLELWLYAWDAEIDALYMLTIYELIHVRPDLSRATGYTYDGTQAWTANTCCYSNVPLAQADISPSITRKAIDKTSGTKTFDVTAIVRDWIAAPTTNYGLLIDADANVARDRWRYFESSESPDPTHRPVLVVTTCP